MHEHLNKESATEVSTRLKKNKVSICIGCLLILFAILAGIVATNKQLRAEGRMVYTPFPWKACGVSISEATARWVPAKQNPRLQNRPSYYEPIAYFPAAEIHLKEANGKGRIFAYFTDSRGNRIGDLLVLWYENGQFVPRNSNTIQAKESCARINVEAGLQDESDMVLYQVDTNKRLWRLHLDVLPDNAASQSALGFTSVSDIFIKGAS